MRFGKWVVISLLVLLAYRMHTDYLLALQGLQYSEASNVSFAAALIVEFGALAKLTITERQNNNK